MRSMLRAFFALALASLGSAAAAAAPDAPVLFQLGMAGYGAGVSLSWTAPATYGSPLGAIRLERSTGGAFSQVRSFGPSVSVTVQSLPCGVGVSLRARAYDADGNSGAASNELFVSVPCAPSLQSVSLDGGALALAWTPAVSTVSLPQSFQLFRASGPAWADAGLAFDSAFPALPLTGTAAAAPDGETRWYRLYTVDAAGTTSAGSNEVALLAPPSGLTATGRKGRVLLSWARPTTVQARGLTAYKVYYSSCGAPAPNGACTAVSIVADSGSGAAIAVTLTGLTDHLDYQFAVASIGGSNTAAVGAMSATVTAIPSLLSPVISTLQAVSGSALSLVWSSVDVEGNTLAAYRVFRATSASLGGLVELAAVTQTSAGGLAVPAPGDAYYFVAVSDTSGNSSALTPSAAGLLFAPSLAAPVLTSTAAPVNGRVQLQWGAVASASTYRVYRATLGVAANAPVFETQDAWVTSGLSYIDTKPVNGEPNVYAVRAERLSSPASGSVGSPLSNSLTLTPWVLPGIPGRYSPTNVSSALGYITTVARPGGPGVDLSWRAADLGSTLLSSYLVYRGYSATVLTLTATLGPTVLSYQDPEAPLPFSSLVYGVQAVDISGYASAVVTSTVSSAIAWPAPLSLAATVLTGGVRLSWASPTGKGSYALSSYAVFRRDQASGPADLLADVTVTSYADLAASASLGAQPTYSVRVRDSLGNVGAAVSRTVSLSGAVPWGSTPSATVLISAQALTGAAAPVLLMWRPNPQNEAVTAYEVWRDSDPTALTFTTGLSFTDSGQLPGAAHAYGVKAVNAYGAGLSNTVSVFIAPPQPGWVSLTADVDAAGDTSPALHLAWQDLGAPSDVTGYWVYRATPASAGFAGAVLLSSTAGTSFVDTDPVLGVSAAYAVLSLLSGTASYQPVTQASSPAMQLPTAPSSLTLTPGTGVSLAWAREAGSREYWVFGDVSPLAVTPSTALLLTRTAQTTFLHLTAGSASVLYYAVAGANSLGRGPAISGSVTPLPGAPTGVTAVPLAGPLSISLSWTAPAAPNGALSYNIYRSTSATGIYSGLTLVANTASTSYVDNAVPAGLTATAIYYLVNSVNLAERWSTSAVSAKTYSAPGVPQGVSASGSSSAVDLRWSPASASEGVDAYQVNMLYVSSGASALVSLPGNASSYRLSGLTPGTEVAFSVIAYTNQGTLPSSAWSLTVSAFANLAGPASAPLSATASVGYRETVPSVSRVVLNWAPVGASNTVLVYRATGPMDLALASGGSASPYYLGTASGTTNWLSDTAVTADQPYSYALSALSPDGLPGGESGAVGLGTVTPFNYSDLVALSATAGDARVDLQWSRPSYAGTYGLASSPFLLYRYKASVVPAFKSLAPDAGFPLQFPAAGSTYSDTQGLLNDNTYFYYMSTVDARGHESSQAQFPRLPAPLTASAAPMMPRGPLQPPTNLTAVAGDRSVALRWTARKSDAVLSAKYNVYRRLSTGTYAGPLPELFQVGPEEKNYVGADILLILMTLRDSPNSADPPQNLQSYCYCLAVVNSYGEGPKSPEVCVTPYKPLSPMPGQEALILEVSGKKDIKLQWATAQSLSPAAGGYALVGYRVYRSQDGGNTYGMLSQLTATVNTYLDSTTAFGAAYLYRVVPLDAGGNEGLSYSLQTVVIPAAQNAVLVFKNAFNPAVGETVPVQFSLQQPGHAWVKVFTLNGEYVATLFDEDVPAATGDSPYLSQKLAWNGANAAGQTVASGVYLIHLEASGFRANARVAVIK